MQKMPVNNRFLHYRMSVRIIEFTAVSCALLCDLEPGKTFQNRSVSSPARHTATLIAGNE